MAGDAGGRLEQGQAADGGERGGRLPGPHHRPRHGHRHRRHRVPLGRQEDIHQRECGQLYGF